MLTGSPHNRKRGVTQVLGLLVLCLAMFPALTLSAAQDEPDPRPGSLTYFYDPSGVYNEGQHATLARDAMLLQSSNIPTVVYVRSTTPAHASPENADAFADAIRESWEVESFEGADDGLVLLYSHVPNNAHASTVVASWGTATFDHSGLSPEYIESVLAGNVRSLLDQGHPFEALVYGMRELRYAGIYYPPTPEPLEGTTKTLHSALNWVAPVLLAVVVATYTTMSFRLGHMRPMPQRLVWKTTGGTLALIALLSAISVIGRSEIGIACTLLTLVALAIQVWMWTHPAKRPSPGVRYRSVPPTSRLMRKVRQARRMHLLPGGQR